MNEQVYKKKGRRYYPIGYSDGFTGFPMEGIWYVQNGDGRKSEECMMRLGEIQDLHPTIDLLVEHRDKIVEFLFDRIEKGQLSVYNITMNDFVADMLKHVGRDI